MNWRVGILLSFAALVAVFAALGIFQSRQGVPTPSAAACSGTVTQAQLSALLRAGAQVNTDFPAGPPRVSTSGDAALQTSEQQLGAGVTPARCLVEVLVSITVQPGSAVLTATDFRGWQITSATAWMVILQGVGEVPPTPTVPAYAHPSPSADPNVITTASASLDLVVFVDADSNLYLGSASIPASTEH